MLLNLIDLYPLSNLYHHSINYPIYFQFVHSPRDIILNNIINHMPSHPYLEFPSFLSPPTPTNISLLITSIIEQPYSLVPSILADRPNTPNLTYVPQIDGAAEDQQVLYYFIIAFVLILLVILTFIRSEPQKHSQLYHVVPHRSSEILVLEQEEEGDNLH